jgi:hypothetical protein
VDAELARAGIRAAAIAVVADTAQLLAVKPGRAHLPPSRKGGGRQARRDPERATAAVDGRLMRRRALRRSQIRSCARAQVDPRKFLVANLAGGK